MRSISSTMKRLAAQQARTRAGPTRAASTLAELIDFGSNPGGLRALYQVPDAAISHPALVVVLHGCTQNAAGFDRGAGWTELAERHGFAVLLPEQTRSNNFNLCFNWYDTADNRRDGGEPLSISQMIDTMADRHGVDRARVFVTGLSAGGAMAAVMLATYPEVFAGGAIVAGLPYGSAARIPEAFDRMRGHGLPDPSSLAKAVRAASAHRGPWPRIAVWHGTGDMIVDPANSRAAVEQWRTVHGVETQPAQIEQSKNLSYRAWSDQSGQTVVEEFVIPGMTHGEPLATTGAGASGMPGPYMLEVGISAARRMAATWGLMTDAARTHAPLAPVQRESARLSAVDPRSPDVGRIIDDALRAAGLMR